MEHKLMELIPQDVWQLIAHRLSQKERSSARAASRFFFKRFTPEWDRYSRECRKIRAIAAGGNHSLLLTETGELFGCGNNERGQLGLGNTQNQASWIKLSENAPVRAIATGGYHSLLLTEARELFGCGSNIYGQLGLGHGKTQACWANLNPFAKSHCSSFEELVQQRYFAFLSVPPKAFLNQCDALFQQLQAEDDKAKHLALFSEMKFSFQAQLTEPLPAPWDQAFNDLNVDEFNPFYQRLREHFKLAPAEDSLSSNLLTI